MFIDTSFDDIQTIYIQNNFSLRKMFSQIKQCSTQVSRFTFDCKKQNKFTMLIYEVLIDYIRTQNDSKREEAAQIHQSNTTISFYQKVTSLLCKA